MSLLISDLAFSGATADDAKTAVLVGSLLAGLVAAVVLRRRSAHHEARRQE